MQPRRCLEKVVPQNCLCEQGDGEKEKAKDHLKEQQLININCINIHNTV